MQSFTIEGMTCDHCKRAVIQAVHTVDPGAQVEVDLAAGTLDTDSSASAAALAEAIAAEGYRATVTR